MTGDSFSLLDVYLLHAGDHPVLGRAFSELPDTAERVFLLAGPLQVLDAEAYTAFFWSPKTPTMVSLQLFDVVEAMREARLPIMGSFQSEREKGWMKTIADAGQPLILCPALDIFNMSLPFVEMWMEERAVVVTPRSFAIRKPNAAMREERDEIIAAIAEQVFIAYAPPTSNLESLARRLLTKGKPVFVVNVPENAELLALGARGVNAADVAGGIMNLPHTPSPESRRMRQPRGVSSVSSQYPRTGSSKHVDAELQLRTLESLLSANG